MSELRDTEIAQLREKIALLRTRLHELQDAQALEEEARRRALYNAQFRCGPSCELAMILALIATVVFFLAPLLMELIALAEGRWLQLPFLTHVWTLGTLPAAAFWRSTFRDY